MFLSLTSKDLNAPRSAAVAAKVGRFLIIAGGKYPNIEGRAQVLDLHTRREWLPIEDMHQPRMRAACAVISGEFETSNDSLGKI